MRQCWARPASAVAGFGVARRAGIAVRLGPAPIARGSPGCGNVRSSYGSPPLSPAADGGAPTLVPRIIARSDFGAGDGLSKQDSRSRCAGRARRGQAMDRQRHVRRPRGGVGESSAGLGPGIAARQTTLSLGRRGKELGPGKAGWPCGAGRAAGPDRRADRAGLAGQRVQTDGLAVRTGRPRHAGRGWLAAGLAGRRGGPGGQPRLAGRPRPAGQPGLARRRGASAAGAGWVAGPGALGGAVGVAAARLPMPCLFADPSANKPEPALAGANATSPALGNGGRAVARQARHGSRAGHLLRDRGRPARHRLVIARATPP
jgi:hypothetical protein